MRIAGAHVRVSDGRYVAGLAVVEEREVVRALSLPAPAESDVGRQLEELYTVVADLLMGFDPREFALKVTEARGRAPLAVAHRGEGALLAAAGVKGVNVCLWRGAGLRLPAGLPEGVSHQDSVQALCGELGGEPTTASEVAQAAAAALASLKRLGG